MVAQNRYRISRNYKTKQGWSRAEWIDDDSCRTADTWQEAIQKWVDDVRRLAGAYQVISETPSEDTLSGIIEIQLVPAMSFWAGAKFKATLIDD